MRRDLIIDIMPLLEPKWTGIPVFTRRLIQCLWNSGEPIDLHFVHRMHAIPSAAVERAIRAGDGVEFTQRLVEYVNMGVRLPPVQETPILYPQIKGGVSVSRKEAGVIHDISTLTLPNTHTVENIAHHLDTLEYDLRTHQTIFCTSQATRIALEAAFPSTRGRTRLLYQYVDWPADFATLPFDVSWWVKPPYALILGTVEPRKNIGLVLRAIQSGRLNHIDMKFVLAGKASPEMRATLNALPPQVQDRLVYLDFVSEFEKYGCIRHERPTAEAA